MSKCIGFIFTSISIYANQQNTSVQLSRSKFRFLSWRTAEKHVYNTRSSLDLLKWIIYVIFVLRYALSNLVNRIVHSHSQWLPWDYINGEPYDHLQRKYNTFHMPTDYDVLETRDEAWDRRKTTSNSQIGIRKENFIDFNIFFFQSRR